jgi:hypothetical protein
VICQTIKAGTECSFMSKKGCSFTGGSCLVIAEQCNGCSKVIEVNGSTYCRVYPEPATRWAYGICPMASHVKKEVTEVVQKLNPLKASKRSKKK